jgi:chorismate mutase
MEISIRPAVAKREGRPVIIAGPCSAETEEQVMTTARALAAQDIDLFRAGIWKPRTRPGMFEGIGTEGLGWLKRVKEETGLKVTTEVASTQHVFDALKYGVDVLWIGARTTVNPFSVQEVADALKGTKIPVIIKNPVNPDLKLWMGAIERIYKAGIENIAVIHRGFSYYGDTKYRNVPRWQIAIELKRQLPDIQIIVDNSHICGNRHMLQAVAQQAFDLNYDGLMTEVHPDPDKAWSDAEQQITPDVFKKMMDELILRVPTSNDPEYLENIDHLRNEIDEIDEELINILGNRMKIAQKIGSYKKRNNIAILQTDRWSEILEKAVAKGNKKGLSNEFIESILRAIHDESISHQEKVMSQKTGE